MSEKFHEQERKWQARLDAMSQRHKEELEQVSDTSSLTVMTSLLSLIMSLVSIKFYPNRDVSVTCTDSLSVTR